MRLDEYRAAKEREMEEAQAMVESIRQCGDPKVRYKDVRPVTDVRHMIETSVELYGDRPAFYVKDGHDLPYRPVTYRKMKEDVDALGAALAEMGRQGGRIAVIGENCYQWAVSYLAAVCGSSVVVPLDKELNAGEIEQLLAVSEAECALFTDKFANMFRKIRDGGKTKLKTLVNMNADSAKDGVASFAECLKDGAALAAMGKRDFLDAQIVNTDLCSLLFTSGTTGIAKGVMLSHRNLAAGMIIPPTVISITKEDIFFSILPLHHCYECTCGFLIPLFRGASIAYCEGLKYIVKNLSQARPTVLLAVPLILENLYKKIWQNAKKGGKEKLLRRFIKLNNAAKKIGLDFSSVFFKQIRGLFGGRMKLIICGGAAIDPDILQGMRDFGITTLQGYGLTECSPICALNPDSAMKNESVGCLTHGFEGKIDGPDPETGIGEICVRGGNVMMGYYDNPEATDEALRGGWFHTGDLGHIDKDRYVYITGRKKNVIITKNGKNVFPEELEYYLGRMEAVAGCMVWGAEGAEDIMIVATIKPSEDVLREALGESFTDRQVEDYLWSQVDELNRELALFKRIRRIVVRKEDFEMTTGKKIKRFVESNRMER